MYATFIIRDNSNREVMKEKVTSSLLYGYFMILEYFTLLAYCISVMEWRDMKLIWLQKTSNIKNSYLYRYSFIYFRLKSNPTNNYCNTVKNLLSSQKLLLLLGGIQCKLSVNIHILLPICYSMYSVNQNKVCW